MKFLLVYLALGCILASMCYIAEKSAWKTSKVFFILVVIFWPILVISLFRSIKYLRWNGKVIWKRK